MKRVFYSLRPRFAAFWHRIAGRSACGGEYEVKLIIATLLFASALSGCKTAADDLKQAVEQNRTLDVVKLLEKGADPNATTQSGTSLLAAAAKNGNLDIVRELLRRGVNSKAKSEALVVSAFTGQTSILDTLIAAGVDPNDEDGSVRMAALPAAIASKSEQAVLVTHLLEHGANPNAKLRGDPILIPAIVQGRVATVRALLAAGADPHAVSANGLAALTAATMSGSVGIVRVLLERGVSSDVMAEAIRTATLKGDLGVASALLLPNDSDVPASIGYRRAKAAEIGFQIQDFAGLANTALFGTEEAGANLLQSVESMIQEHSLVFNVVLSPSPQGVSKNWPRDFTSRDRLVSATTKAWREQLHTTLTDDNFGIPLFLGEFVGKACVPLRAMAARRNSLKDGQASTPELELRLQQNTAAMTQSSIKMIREISKGIKQMLREKEILAPKKLQDEFERLDNRLDRPPDTPDKWEVLHRDWTRWFVNVLSHLRHSTV